MAKKTSNWPKHLLQWGSLALIVFFLSGFAAKFIPGLEKSDAEAFCPFGGLQALATYVQRGSLPCSMTSLQIIMGIFLAAATMLLSKLFCGYLCPVGTVEDLLKSLREGFNINGIRVHQGSFMDKFLRIFKYGLLFYIFYMTIGASELFCKKLDPYYAVATGFKGEIVLWMSVTSLVLVLLFGILIDRFWCRYVCPLGALSNTFKFWGSVLLLAGVCWCMELTPIGGKIPWVAYLGAFCFLGYFLEIVSSHPRLHPLRIVRNEDLCNHRCRCCEKSCPYGINVTAAEGRINDVDCTLCGQCITSCPSGALSIGIFPKDGDGRKGFARFIPAIATVVLVAAGFFAGRSFELPTINENWDVEEGMKLEELRVDNLKSVKCFGSSMAFKARMEKIPGVHGVKTYIGSHHVLIAYDPAVVSAEKIQEAVFVPSHFRVESPDPRACPVVKRVTIRAEKMYDKLDLNYLGLQFRQTGRKIYGVESEYDCPIIVHVYMDPSENPDEGWFREVVEKKTLDMPVHGGGVKSTPVDIDFVRLEKNSEKKIPVKEYLEKFFDPFKAEFNGRYPSGDTTIVRKRSEVYMDQPQFIYEIADQNYEKPIIKRALPFLSNHISREEGVIGLYLRLNSALVPSIQIRYAEPMTAARIWELVNMDKWTITYKEGEDVREEDARLKFKNPGKSYPITE